MNWTQVDIYTTTDGIDLLCSDLMDLGIRGFSIQDAEDFNEFLQNKDGKWDYIDEDLMGLSHCESCVTIYLPEDAQGAETLQMVQELLKRKKAADTEGKFGRLEAVLTGVKEEDWANNWKQYFKPFPVGEKLYIRPSWEHDEPEAGRTVLEIDPESSFGTGQHHTTRLCLELMESAARCWIWVAAVAFCSSAECCSVQRKYLLWTSKKTLSGLQRKMQRKTTCRKKSTQYVAETYSQMKRCGQKSAAVMT